MWECENPQQMGGVVFSVGEEIKVFSSVFRGFGKNMVEKRYFQH